MLPVQWKDVSASQLMDSKLKCVFEMSADGVMVCMFCGLNLWLSDDIN